MVAVLVPVVVASLEVTSTLVPVSVPGIYKTTRADSCKVAPAE